MRKKTESTRLSREDRERVFSHAKQTYRDKTKSDRQTEEDRQRVTILR